MTYPRLDMTDNQFSSIKAISLRKYLADCERMFPESMNKPVEFAMNGQLGALQLRNISVSPDGILLEFDET